MRKSEIEKEMDRILDEMRKASYKCKCGRTVLIANQDRALCENCGHWVYKSKALEFKYKLQENLIKERRNNK